MAAGGQEPFVQRMNERAQIDTMSKPAQVRPNKSMWLKCGIKFCCPGLCLVSLNLWTRSRDGCGVTWRPFKHNISCLTCARWVQSTLGGFTGWLLTRSPLLGIGVNGDVIRMCIPASGINTCGKNSSWSTVSNSISLLSWELSQILASSPPLHKELGWDCSF